jgi:hypothetical protein
MARDPNIEDDSPLMDAMISSASEGFRASSEDTNAPRDPFLLRWAKFSSIIVVLAVVLGGGFALGDYVTQSQGESSAQRARARRWVEHDTWKAFRGRFIIGACVGGGIGVVYTIRCLVKKVDP